MSTAIYREKRSRLCVARDKLLTTYLFSAQNSLAGSIRRAVDAPILPYVDIAPVADTVVLMLSEACLHTVLPAYRERCAISMWVAGEGALTEARRTKILAWPDSDPSKEAADCENMLSSGAPAKGALDDIDSD